MAAAVDAPSIPIQRGSVGLAYHRHLDTEILIHRRRIGHVEVMADHFLEAPRASWEVLARLKRFLPVTAHGVGLSLGSADGLDVVYAGKLLEFLDFLKPAWFGEHIAFTRFDGNDLGHFAPLPRCRESVRTLRRNVESLRSSLNCPLILENIAAPFAMPGGRWSEAEFLRETVSATGCRLLLDLHNLHANAENQGFDAARCLEELPLDQVQEAHIAGGFRSGKWLIDSHTRPVPSEVYRLLEAFGPFPAVTLEWDAEFPPFAEMLAQLEPARATSPVQKAFRAPASSRDPDEKALDLGALQREFIRAVRDPKSESSFPGLEAGDVKRFARSLELKRRRSH